MTTRAVEQALRREELRAQCAAQRQQLRDALNTLGAELKPVDRGLSMIRRIRISPVLLAGGAALALGLGSRRALGGVGRAWLIINSLRRVWQVVQTLRTSDVPTGAATARRRPRRERTGAVGAASEPVMPPVEIRKDL